MAAGYLEAFDQFLRADGYDDGERVVTLTDTHSRLYHQGGPAKVSIIEMATQEFLGNVAFLLPDTEIDALWGNIAAAEQAEDNRKAWLASQGLVEHRELRLCCGRTSPTTPPGVEGPAVSPKVTSTTTGSSRARSAASSGSLGGEFVFAGSDAELAALLAEGFTLEMLAAQAQMFSTLSGSGNAKAPVAEVVATGGDGADPVLAALVADGVVENLDEAALLFHAIQISMEDAPAPAQPRWEPPAASSAELSTAAAAAGAAAVVVAKQALSAPPTLQAAIGVRKTSESGNKQGLAVLLEDDIESAAAVRSSPPKWRVVHEHEDDEPASVGCLGCFGGLFNGVRRAQKEHSSEAARPKGKSTLLAKLRRGLARCLGRRARQ